MGLGKTAWRATSKVQGGDRGVRGLVSVLTSRGLYLTSVKRSQVKPETHRLVGKSKATADAHMGAGTRQGQNLTERSVLPFPLRGSGGHRTQSSYVCSAEAP